MHGGFVPSFIIPNAWTSIEVGMSLNAFTTGKIRRDIQEEKTKRAYQIREVVNEVSRVKSR